MGAFKRNQLEQAIVHTLNARPERARDLKLRVQRLLVTDRRLAHPKAGKMARYAFFSEDAPGSGVEIMFTGYEAFALLVGLMLLDQGMPQGTVVSIMRELRHDLESAHRQSMSKDPAALFDEKAIRAVAKPGMIAADSTEPVYLALVKLPDPERGEVDARLKVCASHDELMAFIKEHSVPGTAATFFAFVGLMHRLARELAQTRPVKRGRSSI